jgi:predicted small lipoprotein YifL
MSETYVMPSRLSYPLLIVCALALGVSACGRRGQLEPPPEQIARVAQGQKPQGQQAPGQPPAQTPAEEAAADVENESITPIPIGQAKARPRGPIIPKTPFILDPLL